MERQKILIISADRLQAKFILDCLVDAGYEAWVVEMEGNPIEMIQKVNPDMVILDWGRQPDRGLKLICSIREADRSGNLSILVSIGRSAGAGDPGLVGGRGGYQPEGKLPSQGIPGQGEFDLQAGVPRSSD